MIPALSLNCAFSEATDAVILGVQYNQLREDERKNIGATGWKNKMSWKMLKHSLWFKGLESWAKMSMITQ